MIINYRGIQIYVTTGITYVNGFDNPEPWWHSTTEIDLFVNNYGDSLTEVINLAQQYIDEMITDYDDLGKTESTCWEHYQCDDF